MDQMPCTSVGKASVFIRMNPEQPVTAEPGKRDAKGHGQRWGVWGLSGEVGV